MLHESHFVIGFNAGFSIKFPYPKRALHCAMSAHKNAPKLAPPRAGQRERAAALRPLSLEDRQG